MSEKKPSFEQAMNVASLWCNSWEKGSLSDEVLADRIAELVATKIGARGFLVIALSSDCPLMDRLPDPIVFQLRKAGELIVELTVKNLVMSSAMSLHHKNQGDKELSLKSERITARCTDLLRSLEPNIVKKHLESFLEATEGRGDQVRFLENWHYSEEQKLEIAISINSIATN
ncbi:hypothetical protein [Prochlorococcus sp. MIT 1223]|uniref:hypothetical protein n=1 Tax=Prochlorococcus sp. MIT 1223 TaxID=3096217 RepID=UPI002A74AEBD|nr:hypothetical protein [Prochlorococcus sp. MIT 1223]